MTVYIFTGPTIAAEDASQILDAVYLPPVQQGDVYRVTRRRPTVIGIIDGYFEHVPAVWHKEILHALTEGIAVFGSSSMGALRAAELAPFGMRGVGEVFEAYVSGDLEDDDEVAVAHGPADTGYRMSSEAMVNIRSTMRAAIAGGVVTADTASALVVAAKALFYPERSWPAVLAAGRDAGLPADELAALRGWVRDGRVDQKRLDAEELLRQVGAWRDAGSERPKIGYRVERTIWWDHLIRHAGATAAAAGEDDAANVASGSVALDDLIDELRVQGDSYRRAIQGAMVRHLCLAEADRESMQPTRDQIGQALEAFRIERGLFDTDELEQWLRSNDLTPDQLVRLVRDDVLVEWAHTVVDAGVIQRLPDHLRVVGRFEDLVQRAREKRQHLLERGLDNPGLADAGLTLLELVAWHAKRNDTDGPASDDEIDGYGESIGFASEADLTRALLREYFFDQRDEMLP